MLKLVCVLIIALVAKARLERTSRGYEPRAGDFTAPVYSAIQTVNASAGFVKPFSAFL